VTLAVVNPGLLTSVQDLGRWGWQHCGVVVGGVLDDLAAQVANALVGNEPNAAVLELAQLGPDLRFDTETLAAWCGADFPARVAGEPFPRQHTVRIAAGETVSFGLARAGWRAWLAVAGGLDEPVVLGSRSTYRRAGFGGHQGRSLVSGDRLELGEPSGWARRILEQLRAPGWRASPWSVDPASLGEPAPRGVVRAVRGPEWEWFAPESPGRLFSAAWRVTKDADRMGMRLEGPALELRAPREAISAAVTAGVVQAPPGRQLIVLLASRQTVGGYPRLAAVSGADLGALAQLRPGDPVRFAEIPLPEAHRLQLLREDHLALARAGLSRLAV
jgi:antagonist of KipI